MRHENNRRARKHEPFAFCSTILGFPVALQASPSAPQARIGHLDTFFILPLFTTATVLSINGYYEAVWYKFNMTKFVRNRPEKWCTDHWYYSEKNYT